jgi:hypothetical protein
MTRNLARNDIIRFKIGGKIIALGILTILISILLILWDKGIIFNYYNPNIIFDFIHIWLFGNEIASFSDLIIFAISLLALEVVFSAITGLAGESIHYIYNLIIYFGIFMPFAYLQARVFINMNGVFEVGINLAWFMLLMIGYKTALFIIDVIGYFIIDDEKESEEKFHARQDKPINEIKVPLKLQHIGSSKIYTIKGNFEIPDTPIMITDDLKEEEVVLNRVPMQMPTFKRIQKSDSTIFIFNQTDDS